MRTCLSSFDVTEMLQPRSLYCDPASRLYLADSWIDPGHRETLQYWVYTFLTSGRDASNFWLLGAFSCIYRA